MKKEIDKILAYHSLVKVEAQNNVIQGAHISSVTDENTQGLAEQYDSADLQQHLETGLMILSSKQREIIARRFGLLGYECSTLQEIGTIFGLTRQSIHQIQVRAMHKLRKNLKEKNIIFENLLDQLDRNILTQPQTSHSENN